MAVQTYPYMAITDSSTTVTIQNGLGTITNYQLVRETFIPRLPRRRKSKLAGRERYEEVIQELELNITGADAATALANLETLKRLLDQAEDWSGGVNVNAVLFKFSPAGSTISSTTAPLQTTILERADGDQTDDMLLNPKWDTVAFNYLIPNVVVRFRCQGLLKESSETDSNAEFQTGLISGWKMDEASGNALDAVGTNDLTDINSVGTAAGKIGTSRQFNSASSRNFSHADNADLRTGNIDFLFSAQVYLDSKPAAPMTILSKGTAATVAGREYFLSWQNTSDRFAFSVGDGVTLTTATANNFGAPAIGAWYFIVAYHDSVNNVVGIRVNNGTANTAAHTPGAQVTAGAFRIGSNEGPGNYWDGRIDEVYFFKRILSDAEQTAFYNSGAGKTYPKEYNGDLVTIGMGNAVALPSPTRLSVTNFGYGASAGGRFYNSLILLAEAATDIQIVNAETGAGGAFTSVDGSAKNARNTNILRYTAADTNEATSATLGAPAIPNAANLLAVYANVRPSASVGFQLRARVDSDIYNAYTPWAKVPAYSGILHPYWVCLGFVPKKNAITAMYLGVKATAAAGVVDIDTVVVCDARTVQVIELDGPSDTENVSAVGAATLEVNHNLLSLPTPTAIVGTRPVTPNGDLVLMTKAATLYALLLSTGDNKNLSGDRWRQTDVTVLRNTWTAYRRTAYLTPQ